jgi:hypothetical protein
VKPATTVTKVVPVNYEREIMTMVQPATEKRIPVPGRIRRAGSDQAGRRPPRKCACPIPAEYADVPQEVHGVPGAGVLDLQLLCDVNATPAKVAEIQESPEGRRLPPGLHEWTNWMPPP